MHGRHRVEQMREPDALGLGNQPEECAVAVEAPRPALLDDVQSSLVVAVKERVGDAAGGRLVGRLQGFGAEPPDADHAHQCVGNEAADRRTGLQLFEFHRRAEWVIVVRLD